MPGIFSDIAGLLPSVRAERRVRTAQAMLKQTQEMIRRVEYLMMGSSATFIGDNRVLLRVIAGTHLFILYVHADDKLISPWLIVQGRYEPEVTDFFTGALQPDSHCLDIGANLGYFTCLFGKYCPQGRVLGVEPNDYVHALAVDNVLVNALGGHCSVLNVAASDRVGEIELYRRVGRDGNTSLAQCGAEYTEAMREPPEEVFRVPTLRVDDLLDRMSGRIDFLKVDVEGAEPLVFASAGATIATNPQLQVVMEWAPHQIQHAGFDVAEFVRSLAAMKLRPFLLAPTPLTPISHDELIVLPYQPGVVLRQSA